MKGFLDLFLLQNNKIKLNFIFDKIFKNLNIF